MSKPIITKVTPWGNSFGIRLPKGFVEDNKFLTDEFLEVDKKDGVLHIKKVSLSNVHTKEYFKNGIKKMSPVKDKEYDWGKPVGKEIW